MADVFVFYAVKVVCVCVCVYAAFCVEFVSAFVDTISALVIPDVVTAAREIMWFVAIIIVCVLFSSP